MSATPPSVAPVQADRNIHQQIEEIERELAMRPSVYGRLVASGKLRQSEADEHVTRLKAVLETLCWCRDNRGLLDAARRLKEVRS